MEVSILKGARISEINESPVKERVLRGKDNSSIFTRIWEGVYEDLEIFQPKLGDQLGDMKEDEDGNQLYVTYSVLKNAPGYARLTIRLEPQEQEDDPEELAQANWALDYTEILKPIETNLYFKGLSPYEISVVKREVAKSLDTNKVGGEAPTFIPYANAAIMFELWKRIARGQEYYPVEVAVVTAETTHKSAPRGRKGYVRNTPSNSIVPSGYEWLFIGSPIRQQGKQWRMTRTWHGVESIDTLIYPTGSA